MQKAESSSLAKRPPALMVIDWLVTGATEQQIREALAEKYPDAEPGQVMADVQKQLAIAGRPDVDAVKGWVLMAYRQLFAEMKQVGDFKGALQAAKEIYNIV